MPLLLTKNLKKIEKTSNPDGNAKLILETKIPVEELNSITVTPLYEDDSIVPKTSVGYIDGYEINLNRFDEAKMTFHFDIPNEKKLGVDYNQTIYYVNEEKREMEEVEGQQLDIRSKTVYVNPTHFSKYVLLDKYEREQVIDQNSRLLEENNKVYSEKNIAFAIDSSGSMDDNDKNDVRKTVVKEFIDTLLEKDKVSVVDFDSYGKILQTLTSDKEIAKKSVDLIDSSGGTDIAEGVEKSLTTLINEKGTKVNDYTVLDAIILLTDGDGYYNNSLTQKAIENNVKIYTIGLGKGINEQILKEIAYKTKGQYYHVSSIDKLKKEFMNLNKLITTDKTIDSDNDGLTDWEEENTINPITLLPYKR